MGWKQFNPTFGGPPTLPQLCSQQSQGGEVNTRQEEPGGLEEGWRTAVVFFEIVFVFLCLSVWASLYSNRGGYIKLVLETESYSKLLANE